MRGQFVLLYALLFSTQAWGVCSLYANYSGVSTDCTYSMATPDFSLTESPVCGAGRVAVSGDGNYTWSSFSSGDIPASSNTFVSPAGDVYKYVQSLSSPPVYGYNAKSRCVCLGLGGITAPSRTYSPAAVGTYSLLPAITTTGKTRMYGDTIDIISAQNSAATQKYSPVAMDNAGGDGSVYAAYATAKTSSCSCPNVNEKIVANDSSDSASGSTCIPAVPTDPFRVFTPFNPTTHAAQIISPDEVSSGGVVVSNVLLKTADQINTASYARKIWTCASPYELDTSTQTCVYSAVRHACSSTTAVGSWTGSPTSPVSAVGDGLSFDDVINKKLACCMNAFNMDAGHTVSTDPYEKFDCVDNSTGGLYADFNALWSSSDVSGDGGQLNAVMLMSGGKPVTGFYTLNGQHCDEFSEFAFPAADGIQPYTVDPPLLSGQQNAVGASPVAAGTAIPLPAGAAYTALQTKVALKRRYPNTLQDYQTCPVLVRAAMIASCPSPSALPTALTAFNDAGKARCPVAAGIQIHLKMEQVYEITGHPKLKTFDTLIEATQTSSIDISAIIANKYGDVCAPGTLRRGENCAY